MLFRSASSYRERHLNQRVTVIKSLSSSRIQYSIKRMNTYSPDLKKKNESRNEDDERMVRKGGVLNMDKTVHYEVWQSFSKNFMKRIDPEPS